MNQQTEQTDKELYLPVCKFAYTCHFTGMGMTFGAIRKAQEEGELAKVKKLLDELERDIKETKEAFNDYVLALKLENEKSKDTKESK